MRETAFAVGDRVRWAVGVEHVAHLAASRMRGRVTNIVRGGRLHVVWDGSCYECPPVFVWPKDLEMVDAVSQLGELADGV